MTKRAHQSVVSNARVLRPDGYGAFCRPVGVRLVRGFEKTEDPDQRQNASWLFTPRQVHLSQRKLWLNCPSHPCSCTPAAGLESPGILRLAGGLVTPALDGSKY